MDGHGKMLNQLDRIESDRLQKVAFKSKPKECGDGLEAVHLNCEVGTGMGLSHEEQKNKNNNMSHVLRHAPFEEC
jgi:hypothetical protein